MAEQVLSPQISSSYGWSWFIFFTLGFLRLVMPLAISANALSNRTGRGGEGKTEVPGEKTLGARARTSNKLNPHMTPNPGIEHGSHWWKASALATAPTLVPRFFSWIGHA